MTALEKERKYTSEEFLAMTDLEGRYELIDGVIYDMAPAPSVKHQIMSFRICKKIDDYIIKNNGKCQVLMAPLDVHIEEGTTVQPDIFVVCDPEKLDEQKCNGAPDWVIEILSPSNSERDTVEKLSLYSRTGVREYWIVDPMSEKVLVYSFEHSNAVGIFTFDDDITAGIYKDEPEPLTIRISKII